MTFYYSSMLWWPGVGVAYWSVTISGVIIFFGSEQMIFVVLELNVTFVLSIDVEEICLTINNA